MEKLDLTKKYKRYYTARTVPELVNIEKAYFLSITGKGDPAAGEFAAAIEALYATAYTVKFMFKAKNRDFVVAKLEGLWWFDEQQYGQPAIEEAPTAVPRHAWQYRLLIQLPDFVQEQDIQTATHTVIEKKQLQKAKEIALFTMTEGKVVQMLHVGPFDKEPETLQQIKAFIQAHHLQKNGLHHEIYLSDFRKTAPDKLRTILREPVL